VNRLKKIALGAASTVVAALCLELVVRGTVGFVEPTNAGETDPPIVEYGAIPGARKALKPNATGRHAFPSDPRGYFDPDGSLTYRTNALAFRGPETSRAKPPGVFRIIGLGDSFTFGRGVRYDDTFLARLQQKLDAAAGPGAFEVLNWGTAGYDTTDEAALLAHRGPAFDPDLVVLCFFLNDTRPGPTAPAFNRVPERTERPSWRRASAFLDQVAHRLDRSTRLQVLVADYHAAYRDDAPGWRDSREALTRARDQARREGFALAVMIFPVLWDLSGPSPFADIHAKIAAYADSLGLPVLDLLPAFAGREGPELWAHPVDQHPSPEGHAIAADALFRFLREQELTPLDRARS
jgi:lysophospholipase L1-like esterase